MVPFSSAAAPAGRRSVLPHTPACGAPPASSSSARRMRTSSSSAAASETAMASCMHCTASARTSSGSEAGVSVRVRRTMLRVRSIMARFLSGGRLVARIRLRRAVCSTGARPGTSRARLSP
jgi:hypothetical protein